MTIDEDGDRIFIRQGEKCPFWNSDMLCDIYINLGENHLCHTCKEFRNHSGLHRFCEHTLSFACPEAARLMLESDFDTGFATDIPQDSQTDYSTTEMNFLLSARKRTLKFSQTAKCPCPKDCADFLPSTSECRICLTMKFLMSRLCRQMNIKSKAAEMRHLF